MRSNYRQHLIIQWINFISYLYKLEINDFLESMKLIDKQLALMKLRLSVNPKRPHSRGRPPAHSQCSILERIILKLNDGVRWQLLLEC